SDAEYQRFFALLVLGLDLRRGQLILDLLVRDFEAVDDLAVDVDKVRDVFDLRGHLRRLRAHVGRGSGRRLRAWRRLSLLGERRLLLRAYDRDQGGQDKNR